MQGEICVASSRLFVQEGIYEKLVEKLVEKAKAWVVGDPFDPKVQHGPQVWNEKKKKNDLSFWSCITTYTRVLGANNNQQRLFYSKGVNPNRFVNGFPMKMLIFDMQVDKQQFEKILSYIEHGKKEGATLLTGGRPLGEKGYYIEPTIFAEVKVCISLNLQHATGYISCFLV